MEVQRKPSRIRQDASFNAHTRQRGHDVNLKLQRHVTEDLAVSKIELLPCLRKTARRPRPGFCGRATRAVPGKDLRLSSENNRKGIEYDSADRRNAGRLLNDAYPQESRCSTPENVTCLFREQPMAIQRDPSLVHRESRGNIYFDSSGDPELRGQRKLHRPEDQVSRGVRAMVGNREEPRRIMSPICRTNVAAMQPVKKGVRVKQESEIIQRIVTSESTREIGQYAEDHAEKKMTHSNIYDVPLTSGYVRSSNAGKIGQESNEHNEAWSEESRLAFENACSDSFLSCTDERNELPALDLGEVHSRISRSSPLGSNRRDRRKASILAREEAFEYTIWKWWRTTYGKRANRRRRYGRKGLACINKPRPVVGDWQGFGKVFFKNAGKVLVWACKGLGSLLLAFTLYAVLAILCWVVIFLNFF